MSEFGNVYWPSYGYEYDGAYAMIVNVSVRANLESAISTCMTLGMLMGHGMNIHLIQRRSRCMNIHMILNMNMCMHMRVGTNTNWVIALSANIDLHLKPYDNRDDADHDNAYESTYAYAYAHGNAQWHGYGYVCAYGYACESMDQGDETCHLISLRARAEFIHPDDMHVTCVAM